MNLRIPLLVLAVVVPLHTTVCRACSALMFHDRGVSLVARNLDWHADYPGLLVLNPRNTRKQALGWTPSGPALPKPDAFAWTSAFGSVTFTAIGREFPAGGINERGLVVEEMTLGETQYPNDPSKTALFTAQWMQYLLDTCATVDEVGAALKSVVPAGPPNHFLIGDADGRCCVVEFLGGKAVVHRDAGLPVRVSTNGGYRDHADHLLRHRGFGGDAEIPTDHESRSRFVIAADGLRRLRGRPAASPEDMFAILDRIGDLRGGTRRQIVYDLVKRRIVFRTQGGAGACSVELAKLDFEGAARMLPLGGGASGDVTGKLVAFDPAANERIVRTMWNNVRRDPDARSAIDGVLRRNRQTLDDWIGVFAAYPGTCRKEK